MGDTLCSVGSGWRNGSMIRDVLCIWITQTLEWDDIQHTLEEDLAR